MIFDYKEGQFQSSTESIQIICDLWKKFYFKINKTHVFLEKQVLW